MNEISLEILVSNNREIYSISVSAGNAHIVVKLTNQDVIATLIDRLESYKNENKAEWTEIGSFGNSIASFFTGKTEMMIIVDGEECGDGSSQSMGIHFSTEDRSVLAEKLRTEKARVMSI